MRSCLLLHAAVIPLKPDSAKACGDLGVAGLAVCFYLVHGHQSHISPPEDRSTWFQDSFIRVGHCNSCTVCHSYDKQKTECAINLPNYAIFNQSYTLNEAYMSTKKGNR